MAWLSIPGAVAGRGRRMGALALATYVPSHTDVVDGMSIPVAAMSILVQHCWYLLKRTEKICKRTDTAIAFTRRVLNIVSTRKHMSQLHTNLTIKG
jgi:hypothetical protein